MIDDAAERVFHAVGVARTVGGGRGLRIDAPATPDDLPPEVWVRSGTGDPVLTGVLGACRDGWVVVADVEVSIVDAVRRGA